MTTQPIYYHNYLFPHNEKRTYRNQLTLLGDGVQYLGVTIKDKTNRHWQIINVLTPNQIVKNFKKLDCNRFTPKSAINIKTIAKRVVLNAEPDLTNPDETILVYTRKNKWLLLTEQLLLTHPYKGKCCYCETKLYYGLNYSRDHILPKSRGGRGGRNLKPCCCHCNSEKGDLMLHSYIQLLNYSLDGVLGGPLYEKIQIKIKNSNKIAKGLNNPSPQPLP